MQNFNFENLQHNTSTLIDKNPIEEATAFSIRIKSIILSEYGKNATLVQYQDDIQEKIRAIARKSHDDPHVKKLSELYSLNPYPYR